MKFHDRASHSCLLCSRCFTDRHGETPVVRGCINETTAHHTITLFTTIGHTYRSNHMHQYASCTNGYLLHSGAVTATIAAQQSVCIMPLSNLSPATTSRKPTATIPRQVTCGSGETAAGEWLPLTDGAVCLPLWAAKEPSLLWFWLEAGVLSEYISATESCGQSFGERIPF